MQAIEADILRVAVEFASIPLFGKDHDGVSTINTQSKIGRGLIKLQAYRTSDDMDVHRIGGEAGTTKTSPFDNGPNRTCCFDDFYGAITGVDVPPTGLIEGKIVASLALAGEDAAGIYDEGITLCALLEELEIFSGSGPAIEDYP